MGAAQAALMFFSCEYWKGVKLDKPFRPAKDNEEAKEAMAKRFFVKEGFSANELLLLAAAIHLLKHHPDIDEDEDNIVWKAIDTLNNKFRDSVDPDDETAGVDSPIMEFAMRFQPCSFSKMVWDTYTTVNDMVFRQASLMLRDVRTEFGIEPEADPE